MPATWNKGYKLLKVNKFTNDTEYQVQTKSQSGTFLDPL